MIKEIKYNRSVAMFKNIMKSLNITDDDNRQWIFYYKYNRDTLFTINADTETLCLYFCNIKTLNIDFGLSYTDIINIIRNTITDNPVYEVKVYTEDIYEKSITIKIPMV